MKPQNVSEGVMDHVVNNDRGVEVADYQARVAGADDASKFWLADHVEIVHARHLLLRIANCRTAMRRHCWRDCSHSIVCVLCWHKDSGCSHARVVSSDL